MTDKEVREIKKTLSKDNTTVKDIGFCCIMHGEDGVEVRNRYKKTLLNLPKEEYLKYFSMFGKMFGQVGTKFLETDMPDGDAKKVLSGLAEEGLQDYLMDIICNELARHEVKAENLGVFFMKGSYDVPVRTDDNIKNDESDEIYPHIMCIVCPVELSPAGIMFDSETGEFTTIRQIQEVKAPTTGFLYPAFTDRSADYDHIMIYASKASELENNIILSFTESAAPAVAVKPRKKKEPVNAAAAAEADRLLAEDYKLKKELTPDFDETAFKEGYYASANDSAPWDSSRTDSSYTPGRSDADGYDKAEHDDIDQDEKYIDTPLNSLYAAELLDKDKAAQTSGSQRRRHTRRNSEGRAVFTADAQQCADCLADYEDIGTVEEFRTLKG